jgi:predicted small metal-binding protein
MKKIADHAKSAHKIDIVPPDLMAKIKKAIKK